ncbi:MAG: hypothetical protein ACODAD_06280, partial [Planctomycetota bacterium]
MSNSKCNSAQRKGRPSTKPKAFVPPKPYPDFPLTPSSIGYWVKSIRGKIHRFGKWGYRKNGEMVRLPDDGWRDALDEYERTRDALYAGQKPKPKPEDRLSIKQLVNRFLFAKEQDMRSGELTARSWRDYDKTCGRVVRVLGLGTAVEDLEPDDFRRLRADITQGRGPSATANEMVRIRSLFKFGWQEGLLERPIRFGQAFKPPSRKAIRKARHANGSRMFEPEELRTLIDAANMQLRAMILIACN